MRHVINLSMLDPRWQVELAVEAERLGFDAVSMGDSLFYPETSESTYPYTASGDRTFLEGQPFADPLVTGAAICERTDKLKFQISVLKLSVRHPILVAKQAASLAVLSNNRLKLGVGMSPWPEDYAALDVREKQRGRRFDEAIALVRALTRGGYVEHHGEIYDLPSMRIDPVPTSPIPLLIGGHSHKNLRRAAQVADGWIAATAHLETLAELIEFVDTERSAAWTNDGPFEIHASAQQRRTREGVEQLGALGVTDVNLRPTSSDHEAPTLDAQLDGLRQLAHDLLT